MDIETLKSFITGMAAKFTAEDVCEVEDLDSLKLLKFKIPVQWEWPRSFQYKHEFFAINQDPTRVTSLVRDYYVGTVPEHGLFVYHRDLEEQKRLLCADLYASAYESTIFHKKPGLIDISDFLTPGLEIIEVSNRNDLNAFNSIEPGYRHTELNDVFCNILLEVNGSPACKGQLVIADKKCPYVVDIFTQENYRKKGLGKLLMMILENKAIEMGAEKIVTAASYFAMKTRFYEKCGYKPAAKELALIKKQTH